MQDDLWDQIVEKLNAGNPLKLAELIDKRLTQITQIQNETFALVQKQKSLQQQKTDLETDMNTNDRLLDELWRNCEHWVRDANGQCIACQEWHDAH